MESRPIILTIGVRIVLPAPCPPNLGDILRGDEAEDYLYDLICSWVRRYVSRTLSGFDLAVAVTVVE